MECAIIGIPDFLLAVFLIVGFLSRKNPVAYRSPWALGAGVVLLITSLLDAVGANSPWVAFLEFIGILMAGLQIEHFVSTNTDRKALYWLFGAVITLVLLTVGVARSPIYFEVGLLVILGIATVRLSSMESLFGTEIKFPLLASATMAFLSALSLALGFEMLSTFLYFGALILLILTILENVMGII